MIRINLLETDRGASKGGVSGIDLAQKITVIGSLILLLAVVGIGWRYWALGQENAAIARDLADARAEEARLQEILKQVQEFEAQRAQLQQRLSLIDELRRGQSAPVHMVDQISRALPEMTWLTGLRQSGYEVTIEGRCLSLTSLSDFIGNLEASRYFQRPVEIVESSVVPGTDAGPDLIQFSIRGTFQMAGIETTPPEAAKGPAKKGGPRG